MAELKRRSLILSTGKQIKFFGSCIAIGKSLEIGEGYAPNLFPLLKKSWKVKLRPLFLTHIN
jgi:hypothetical protein